MHKTLGIILAGVSAKVAPWVAGLVLFVWVVVQLQKLRDRARLDKQSGIDSIRALSWSEFERLLAEAYRRQGYAVEHAGKAAPDGGVDLRLRRPGELLLVQCKHWKNRNVGVRVVRELKGVVAAESATGGVVVATGEYTRDARDFAARSVITLVGGMELAAMIRSVQARSTADEPVDPSRSTPRCPACDSPMALRTAKQGPHAGTQFWGCLKFPKCRGTRQFAG